nr:cation:dicarboxylase symporter family transporter [Neobacillus terrae]
MNIFLIIVNLAVFLLLLAGLFKLQKKHVSFSKRVFTALGLGIIFGFIIHYIYGTTDEVTVKSVDWFNVVGIGYVKLLQMIIMPLVFISIVSAFTKLQLTKNIGKISFLVLGILLGTTAISGAIGIGSALGFGLDGVHLNSGDAEASRNEQLQQTFATVKDATLPQQIVQLLPANPFQDLTGARPTSTIAVVIFAAFVGFAYLGVNRKESETAVLFSKAIDMGYSIVMRIVRLILRLSPYGIFAIITRVAATSDYAAIAKLGTFVIASYVALIIMFLVHLLLLSLAKLSPISYVKRHYLH